MRIFLKSKSTINPTKEIKLKNLILSLLGLFFGGSLLNIQPSYAADRILLNYDSFELPLSVQALETYVQTGTAPAEIQTYLSLLTPQQREQFQQLLKLEASLSATNAQHLLQEPIVNALLEKLGYLLTTSEGQNGASAIKQALQESAKSSSRISVLQLLKYYPGDIRIDGSFAFKQWGEIKQLRQSTQALVEDLEKTTTTIATSESLPTLDLKLQQQGPLTIEQQTLELYDSTRNRRFSVDFYRPKTQDSTPILLVENGIGGQRDRFQYLAQHLASHGFAVAIPDHPGSDYQQQRDFISRKKPTFFESEAFIDRPLDDSFLLDELKRLNPSKFQGQLNTQQVGILGFSLGGTTALALAGATFDFKKLAQDCDHTQTLSNLSLLVQCRAQELPKTQSSLRDERVKAAFIFFPFSNSLYGETGLSQVQIPVFWQALAEDFVTPLVVEQVPAFNWLGSATKYLGVISGFAHVDLSYLAKSLQQPQKSNGQLKVQPQPQDNQLTAQPLNKASDAPREGKGIQTALNVFSLVFFKAHVAQDPQYLPYLQASYIKSFAANSPYGVSFVQKISPEQAQHLQSSNNF